MLGLLFASAAIGVHIDRVVGVTLESAIELAEAISRSIGERSGRNTTLDDPTWSSGEACKAIDSCLLAIVGRTGARDVVMLRMFGGPTRIRVDAERFSIGETQPVTISAPVKVEISVPRDVEGWTAPFDEAARSLFPEPPVVSTGPPGANPLAFARTGTLEKEVPSRFGAWSWIALGAGATAAVVGTVFHFRAVEAQREIEGRIVTRSEFEEVRDKSASQSLAGNVLLTTALVAVAGSAVMFLFDRP